MPSFTHLWTKTDFTDLSSSALAFLTTGYPIEDQDQSKAFWFSLVTIRTSAHSIATSAASKTVSSSASVSQGSIGPCYSTGKSSPLSLTFLLWVRGDMVISMNMCLHRTQIGGPFTVPYSTASSSLSNVTIESILVKICFILHHRAGLGLTSKEEYTWMTLPTHLELVRGSASPMSLSTRGRIALSSRSSRPIHHSLNSAWVTTRMHVATEIL